LLHSHDGWIVFHEFVDGVHEAPLTFVAFAFGSMTRICTLAFLSSELEKILPIVVNDFTANQ